jgi:predicted DNA binding CopG/RHH family protein
LVFTIRKDKARVISARDMNKKRKKRRYMSLMKKKIPQFKSEDEEREFLQTHDSTEYVDWKKAKKVTLSNLKPSVKTISLRLPECMLEELKLLG